MNGPSCHHGDGDKASPERPPVDGGSPRVYGVGLHPLQLDAEDEHRGQDEIARDYVPQYGPAKGALQLAR